MPNGDKVHLLSDGTWIPATSGVAPPSSDTPGGFRGVPWGSSMATIKATVSGPPSFEEAEALVYPAVVADLQCNALYLLVNDQLVRAKYILNETYTNANNYLRAVEQLKTALSAKYGVPDSDDSYWSNDLYKDDPQYWGMAVSHGDLTRFVIWNRPEMTIYLALKGENYEVQVEVEYVSNAHQAMIESNQDQRLIDGL